MHAHNEQVCFSSKLQEERDVPTASIVRGVRGMIFQRLHMVVPEDICTASIGCDLSTCKRMSTEKRVPLLDYSHDSTVFRPDAFIFAKISGHISGVLRT
jgi:hypothetical protein